MEGTIAFNDFDGGILSTLIGECKMGGKAGSEESRRANHSPDHTRKAFLDI